MWVHFVDFNVIWRNIIIDIKSSLKPALARFFVGLERPERGLHSVIEQRVTFREVYYVDSDHICETIWISHFEVKPLEVRVTVSIISDPTIIFYLRSLSDLIDVATFELCVKHNEARSIFWHERLLLPAHISWTSKSEHSVHFVGFRR